MSQAQFGIQNFISKFDGGSKATLYRVTINGPGGAGPFQNVRFFGKATSLPASTIGEISVPYMGRTIKAPGDRSYEDWTLTVLNQENMELRKRFEEWNALFNGHLSNVAEDGGLWASVRGYTAIVEQLNRAGNPVRIYELQAVFPREVSSVDVAYDQVDTISEFTVTFAYSYFIPR